MAEAPIDYERGKIATLETYNHSASQLAEYFAGIGPRDDDIRLGIGLTGKSNPRVVEIGCGDGRDAAVILKYTNDYLGMDLSEGMLALARQKNPEADFRQGDLAEFVIPERTDVIFSFASILHSPPDDVTTFLRTSGDALNEPGFLMISTKQGCEPVVKQDEFGERTFYLYEPEDLIRLAPSLLEPHSLDFQRIGSTDWFTLILRKRDGTR